MANYKRREFIKASLSAGFGSAGLGSAIAGSMEYQPSQRKPIQKNKSVIDNYGVEPTYCEAVRRPALFEPEHSLELEFGSRRVRRA